MEFVLIGMFNLVMCSKVVWFSKLVVKIILVGFCFGWKLVCKVCLILFRDIELIFMFCLCINCKIWIFE